MKYLIVTLVLIAALTGCGSDKQTAIEHCLYASIKVYPTWNPKNGAVLEEIRECKGLTPNERVMLRQMMTDFYAATKN